MGYVIPKDVSPPEYMLDLVNSDFGGEGKKQQVCAILNAWKAKAAAQRSDLVDPSLGSTTDLPNKSLPGVSFARQVLVHLRRQALLSVRDPTLYVSRFVIFFVSCVFFAWVYSKARDRTQEEVTDRMFLTVWMIAVPSCMGTIAVFSFNHEFLGMRREIKDGMYSPWAYIISNALLQVPFMVLLSLSALLVGAYGIALFEISGFGRMLLVFSAALWAFEAMAQAMGALFPNPLVGMLVYLFLWFTSFLFAGFFIVGEGIPWPLKVFLYVLPLRWSIASMVKTEFRWSTFEGAQLAPAAAGSPYSGFTCTAPAAARQVCFGRTGEQVLWSLSQSFTSFDPAQETFGTDVACLVGIGLFFKLVFVALFLAGVRHGRQPSRPGQPYSSRPKVTDSTLMDE